MITATAKKKKNNEMMIDFRRFVVNVHKHRNVADTNLVRRISERHHSVCASLNGWTASE